MHSTSQTKTQPMLHLILRHRVAEHLQSDDHPEVLNLLAQFQLIVRFEQARPKRRRHEMHSGRRLPAENEMHAPPLPPGLGRGRQIRNGQWTSIHTWWS